MNFSMLRFLKQIIWCAGLVIGCQSAFGFALIGPIPAAAGDPDGYQIPAIGYGFGGLIFVGNGPTAIFSTLAGYAPNDNYESPTLILPNSDMGTPKSIGEGYRRNTPVMYYSFDASFLNFFGPDGAAQVDKAMAVYNSLTNVSSYSADLSEFPQDSRRVNVRAASATLLDIKSVTMGLMTEQLGFWEPVRWVWALHARAHINGTGIPPCPGGMEYLIDKKNLDVVSSTVTNYQYSSYVNGVLYSYFILEGCVTTPNADAVEFPVDPLTAPYSAVADFSSFEYTGLEPGVFYTSLTSDDVGGLRYLIRQDNRAMEPAGGRVTEFLTNNSPAVITNLDLHLFVDQARTNDAAGLQALYPGLVILSTTNTFGIQITTNVTETLVNNPLDPAGTLPSHAIFSTNYSTNFATFFQHTFGNLVTNTYATRGLIGTANLILTNNPLSPAGTPPQAVTAVQPAFAPGVFGDFIIVPTNFCSALILSNLFSQVIATTNPPVAVSNVVVGGTNAVITFIPGSVNFFTNRVLVYLPVSCPVDPVATYGGIEKIQFIRRDYDSLINQAWDPVTNEYTLMELTNSMEIPRHMQRAVPKPDFLFTAADLAWDLGFTYSNTVANTTESFSLSATVNGGLGMFDVIRSINYDQTARPGNLAGPGTIVTPTILPTLMIFNKVGPLYANDNLLLTTNGFFLGEQTQYPFLNLSWGSFDGSTNAPEVYPNGSSITQLESLLTGPATTVSSLPSATIGVNYFAQLTATGANPPFTWSLAPGSAGLPAGLNLAANGFITGTPTGPAAIYDFTVRVTDSLGAFRDVEFTISVF